jgi:hypothetical protein
MTSENGVPDPYAVVLADLRAKRDQIDSAITRWTHSEDRVKLSRALSGVGIKSR